MYSCENACATSDAYKLKKIIFSLATESEFTDEHLKIINTGTIGKFMPKWGFQKMTYLKDKYEFPVVTKKEFFSLFKNTYSQKSIKPKIIIKGLTLLDACIDEEGIIVPGKSTMMIPCEDLFELKYLLAIINSKVMIFYIKQKYSSSSYNGGINFSKDMINNLPMKSIDKSCKTLLVEKVDKILKAKENDPTADSLTFEAEIDKMVFGFYGLTEEEIKIVEGA